jgi:hypothetical protein
VSPAASLVRLGGRSPRSAREDVQVTRVRALGTWAWIAYQADRRETQRRETFALGAVLGWDLLDTLMDLPAGLPVPLATLDQPTRRRVAGAAPGVARVAGGQVIRDLVPAVTPLLAVVMTTRWRSGLARASRFAPYCRRMVLGPTLGHEPVLPLAGQLGIGVAARRGSDPVQVLLEPEPVRDWQPTTAWWRFCEVTWGQAAPGSR